MNKEKLAEAIHSLSDKIETQQKANSALTARIAKGLVVGVDLPQLQADLTQGVAKLIRLGEEQDELIGQWFET